MARRVPGCVLGLCQTPLPLPGASPDDTRRGVPNYATRGHAPASNHRSRARGRALVARDRDAVAGMDGSGGDLRQTERPRASGADIGSDYAGN